MQKKKFKLLSGFTIVELIVVISVIGILAGITIVSYGAWRTSAAKSQLKSDLNGVLSAMNSARTFNNTYPTTIPSSFVPSNGVTLSGGGNVSGAGFCVTATSGALSYNISQFGIASVGSCPVLYYDAGVGASYPGSGTTWTDLSGNGNTGTLNGGITYSNNGGGALSFDGISGYVSTAILPTYSSFALSIWFKTTSPRDGDRLYWGAGTNRAILANNGTSGKLGWYVQTSTSNTSYQYTATNTVVNQWNNVVLQYTGSQVQCFINGVQDSVTANITGTSNASAFNIGTNYANSGNWYNGQIGIFSFYGRSLSANEIMQNFDSLRGRYGI